MRPQPIRAGTVFTAVAVGSFALLVLGLQPLLLGELIEARRVSLEGAGLVAMAEIVALGLGVLLGDLLQPLSRLRGVTALAALLAAALDLATLRADGDLGFCLVRAGAGTAEGLMVWAATAVIVRSGQPDRMAGVFFVVQTLAQASVGLLLAQLVVPARGWSGAFTLIAALMLLPALLAWVLPKALAPLPPASASGFAWSWRTALPLVVAFLQLAALGSFWAYVEPLGKSAGFTAPAVQTLISAGLLMQVLGGSTGSMLARRLPGRATLIAGSAVLLATALAVRQTAGGATLAFAALCAAFTFTWLFIAPFQMGAAFGVDASGRVGSLIPAAQLFGIACGPLAASFVVDGEQAASVPLVSAAFAAAAVLALALPTRRRATALAQP
ncbi:MFS transporter [Roseateles saccharophilus]|uniref:Putative MFS family arabinose efflux permease n=1 Tax=Roseateles saccharophilus TaxID=304 RepID=A0A4R3UX36_ROSSA|nr:MFS transporter [Roseateles saccharophilus]MDG0832701.1 MFS transporter [Roseateles saccharophilus]TCU95363.1 putative MFS family arabinose efflux permease [Roseateles saccharophilus]